ncbi:BrnA antitoxin family protein [Altericista sp. CCNU0014]|uniref:BrnA antitoxin family protein n=1 Tax=Altericista sp. CCNU0014 TaxID=3082949 RepID=UPI00384B9C3A
MNDVPTGKALSNKPETDWERLRHISDADNHAAIASDPDIIPTDEDFWQNAKVVTPQRKPTITIRLDPDVLDWLKGQGKGYQTRINAILRTYMHARKNNTSDHPKP